MSILSDEEYEEISESLEELQKTINEKFKEIRRYSNLRDAKQQVEDDYENTCNKEITDWQDFREEDIIRELNYCTDYFMLMKEGDIIKCDCGTKEIELYFDGKKIVFKGGTASPTEKDIPRQIKEHEKKCFGTCLLEDPSRHPGTNAVGGNDCEPYIVGTSWLDTYNNAKAENLKTALKKQSWLACKYMGRIMSVEAIEEIDVAGMTEEEAFEMLLAWVRGEQYIPQVILDKITTIYAGQNVNDLDAFPYKGSETINNINKYDVKIIAWSKFVNNLWETDAQKKQHLDIRPVLFKALCMQETKLGSNSATRFNGKINIAQSLNTGDGGIWHMANYNPYPTTFWTTTIVDGKVVDKSNILNWGNEQDSRGEFLTNGYIEFVESDYFKAQKDLNGNVIFERLFKGRREDFFGKADIGEKGSSLINEGIKTVHTHSDYPIENSDSRANKDEIIAGELTMVVYNQQSTDMSLFVGALELANHANTEELAVGNYNGGGEKSYVDSVRGYLNDMGTDFIN